MTDFEVLAVVPARGGSKSVPRKNIKLLGGKPLIAYAIEAGHHAALVDRLIVSTDDQEIASIARSYGAEVPFIRPTELAQDDTPDLPVFQHALRWLERNEGYVPDIVVNLRPTSPLRRPEDIDGAIRVLIETRAESVKSICLASQHPHKMWHLEGQWLTPYLTTPLRLERGPDVPRQELEDVYWQNGAVDATWRLIIVEQNRMIGDDVAAYVMDPYDSIDLDTAWDFLIAEALLKARNGPRLL